MKKFIRNYALEIYTLISLGLLLAGALMDNLSVIQKFVMVYNLLFILHEWEEGYYPGGFIDLISKMIGKELTIETKRASRIPTGILLLVFTFVPFFWDDCVIPILVTATLGIFEGIVHMLGVRLFRMPKFYTPGMVTAELELLTSIGLIVWIEQNNLATTTDYIFSVIIMFVCFILMQRTLVGMVGMKYSELPKRVRAQWMKK